MGGVCCLIARNVSLALAAVMAASMAALDIGTFDGRIVLLKRAFDIATTKLKNFNG